jgi:hypothetical protein
LGFGFLFHWLFGGRIWLFGKHKFGAKAIALKRRAKAFLS